MEGEDQAREDDVQLPIRQVGAGAHARARPVPVMLRAGAGFVDAHEPLRDEVQGRFEVRGVVVGGPHVHEEGRAGGDDGAVVRDVLRRLASEGHVERGPVAEDFLDEGGHVFAFLVRQAAVPGVFVGVGGHDLAVRFLLDFLAVRRREVGDCHVDVAGEGVEAGGDHC